MKKRIIDYIVHHTNVRKWERQKERVLIQLNDYFTEDEWLKKITGFQMEYDFYFTKNKYEFLKLIPTADYVFCFGFSSYIDVSELRCKKIYFGLVGLEFIEQNNLPRDIEICNPRGISSDAIAEYCLSMALALKSKLSYSFHNQYNRKWSQKIILSDLFLPLRNKRIGIMGIGYNGRAIAKIFKKNGCKINGYDEFKFDNTVVDRWFSTINLNSFLSESDIVIVALPETKKTIGLLNIVHFKNMKKDALLINIARGRIINEKDLEIALREKILLGAALDTFSTEPLSKKSKLWKFDNVIITPHIAGNINLFRDQIQEDFIKKVLLKEINNV